MNRIDNKTFDIIYNRPISTVSYSMEKTSAIINNNEEINQLEEKILTIGDLDHIEDINEPTEIVTKEVTQYYPAIESAFKMNTQEQLWSIFLGSQVYRQAALLEQKNKASNIINLKENSEETIIKTTSEIVASNEHSKNDTEAQIMWLNMSQNYPKLREQLEKYKNQSIKITRNETIDNIVHGYCIIVPIETMVDTYNKNIDIEKNINIQINEIVQMLNEIQIQKYVEILKYHCPLSIVTFNQSFLFVFHCKNIVNQEELIIEFKECLLKVWKNMVLSKMPTIGFELSSEMRINKIT